MSNAKKIGILLLLVVLINITPNTLADSYENYITDKEVTALRPGDEIFFDNSGTNSHVSLSLSIIGSPSETTKLMTLSVLA